MKNIKTIYAIPKKNNKNLKKILIKNNCEIFYGPELNVLKRYFLASKNIPTKKIIRITSDCPLIDTNIIKQLIKVDKKKILIIAVIIILGLILMDMILKYLKKNYYIRHILIQKKI